MFNVLSIVLTPSALVGADARAGLRADHRHRDRLPSSAASAQLGACSGRLLRREGFRYRPTLDWRDPGLRRVLLLMGPGTLGLAATQVNVARQHGARHGRGRRGRVVAELRRSGSSSLPIGLFGVSIATRDPTLAVSRQAGGQGRPRGTRSTIAGGLSLMLMMNIPATVGLMALADADRGRDLRARRVRRPTRSPPPRRCKFYAVGLGRLLDRPHRLAALLRAGPQPRARRPSA